MVTADGIYETFSHQSPMSIEEVVFHRTLTTLHRSVWFWNHSYFQNAKGKITISYEIVHFTTSSNFVDVLYSYIHKPEKTHVHLSSAVNLSINLRTHNHSQNNIEINNIMLKNVGQRQSPKRPIYVAMKSLFITHIRHMPTGWVRDNSMNYSTKSCATSAWSGPRSRQQTDPFRAFKTSDCFPVYKYIIINK